LDRKIRYWIVVWMVLLCAGCAHSKDQITKDAESKEMYMKDVDSCTRKSRRTGVWAKLFKPPSYHECMSERGWK
jgi:hypothetical protein